MLCSTSQFSSPAQDLHALTLVSPFAYGNHRSPSSQMSEHLIARADILYRPPPQIRQDRLAWQQASALNMVIHRLINRIPLPVEHHTGHARPVIRSRHPFLLHHYPALPILLVTRRPVGPQLLRPRNPHAARQPHPELAAQLPCQPSGIPASR
jgi:hypothetical protein